MKPVIVATLLITSLSLLSAEAGTHVGLVKINAEEVQAAQVLVSLSVIPAIEALHEWVPKAFAHEEDVALFQRQLIAPKVVFNRSLDILKKVELELRDETNQRARDITSLQDDLKILASSQFYCLEMYSIFNDPKLPMSSEEREQLTQSIKKISKVYLGVSDLLINSCSIPETSGTAESRQDMTY